MTSNSPSYSIRLVFQRYRKARIVLDDSRVVTLGSSEAPLLFPSSYSTDTDTDGDSHVDDTSATSARSKPPKTLGVVVYVSFSSKLSSTSLQGTTTTSKATDADAVIEQAAKTILQLPIQTFGRWGDESEDCDKESSSSSNRNQTHSLLQILSSQQHEKSSASSSGSASPISLLIVPQANLISKVNKNGKSIQYRDQITPKDLGHEMYDKLRDKIQRMLFDHQMECRGNRNNSILTGSKQKQVSATTPDPSIPPNELFRQGKYEGVYATYDPSTGIPLTFMMNTGDSQEAIETISKSARKKLQKIFDAHVKRHEKWKLKQKEKEQQESLQMDQKRQANGADEGGSGDGKEVELEQSKSAAPEAAATIPKSSETDENNARSKADSSSEPDIPNLDPSFVQYVAGSFGKRQGLELSSDMGPFCHIVDI